MERDPRRTRRPASLEYPDDDLESAWRRPVSPGKVTRTQRRYGGIPPAAGYAGQTVPSAATATASRSGAPVSAGGPLASLQPGALPAAPRPIGRFRWVTAPPAPLALVNITLPRRKLPAFLQAATAFSGIELISVGVYLVGGQLIVHLTVPGSEAGYAASVDAAAIAQRLAAFGAGAVARVRDYLARSAGPSDFATVGDARFKIWLSPVGAQPRNFAVFDMAAIVWGLGANSAAGFRPVEARLDDVAGGAVGARVYRGDELGRREALEGKGTRLGSPFQVTSPAMRKIAVRDGGTAVWVSVFRAGSTISFGIAADEAATKGMVVSIDVERLIDHAVNALGKMANMARGAARKLKQLAKALGDKLMALRGRMLRLSFGGGSGGSFFEFDLGLRLPQLVAGGFDWTRLIPDSFRFGGGGGGISLLPKLSWPGPVIGPSFKFPRGALDKLTEYLRRLIPGFSGRIPDLALPDVQLWSLSPGEWKFGLSIDLSGLFPSGRGRKIGIDLDLGALLRRLGGGDLALKIAKLLRRGATDLRKRVSVDRRGILRILLDRVPDPAGNRVGFDLKKFFNGFSADDLVPVELNVKSGAGQMSYGKTADRAGKGPAVLVAPPAGDPLFGADLAAPTRLRRQLGEGAKTIAVKVYLSAATITVFGAVRPGDRGLLLSYSIGSWKQRIGTKVLAMTPRSAQTLVVAPTPRGMFIGTGDPNKPTGTYVIYGYDSLVSLMSGHAEITDLVPDVFRLSSKGGAIAVEGSSELRASVPEGGFMRRIADLPRELQAVLRAISLSPDQVLQVDAAASTMTGGDKGRMMLALVGGVYTRVPQGWEGTKLRLSVDLVSMLKAFLPESLLNKLIGGGRRKKTKTGLGAAFDQENGLTLRYTRAGGKGKKRRSVSFEAGWSLQQLLDMALSPGDIAQDPGKIAPSRFAGSFANDRWKLAVTGKADGKRPAGTRLPLATTPGLAELSSEFLSNAVRARSALYLNVATEALAKRAAYAIAHWEPLTIAGAHVVLAAADQAKNYTFGVSVGIEPAMLLKILEILPAGWVAKVGKTLYEFASDPEAMIDNVFYTAVGTVEAVRSMVSQDVDMSDLSVGDWARLAVAAFDGDMKELIALHRMTRRLLRLGVISGADMKNAKKNFEAYMSRDRDKLIEYMKQVNKQSDRQLRKFGKLRKSFKNNKELKKFMSWYEQLPSELRREVQTMDRLAAKHGVSIDLSGLEQKFDPGAAAARLGQIHRTMQRLRAGASGAAIARELAGAGKTSKESMKSARGAFDTAMGKSSPGARTMSPAQRRTKYDKLDRDQLAGLLRDRVVMVRGANGAIESVELTVGDEGHVAALLEAALGVIVVEDRVGSKDGGDRSGEVGADGGQRGANADDSETRGSDALEVYRSEADAVKAAEAAKSARLTQRQLLRAKRLNPSMVRRYGVNREDLSHYPTNSFGFAIDVADWQHLMGLRADGLVGPKTAAKLRGGGKVRGGDKAGGSAASGSAHANAPTKPQNGKPAPWEATASAPSGRFKLRASEALLQSLVTLDKQTGKLVIVPRAYTIDWERHVASKKGGMRTLVKGPSLEQHVASRPRDEAVIEYRLWFNIHYVAAVSAGSLRSQIAPDRVRSARFLYRPEAARGGQSYATRSVNYAQQLLQQGAIDVENGKVLEKVVTITGPDGVRVWEIDNYQRVGEPERRKGGRTVVRFTLRVKPLNLGPGVTERPIRDGVTGAYRVLALKRPTRSLGFSITLTP